METFSTRSAGPGFARRRSAVAGLALLAGWVIGWVPGAGAQEAVLESSALEPLVGEFFQLQLEVPGKEVRVPQIEVDGLTIDYVGASSSTQLSFGAGRQSVLVKKILAYRAKANRAGQFVIPEIAVTTDGKVLTSNSLTLTAREPGDPAADGSVRSPTAFIRIEAERAEIFVGESAGAKVKVYFGPGVQVNDLQREIALQGEDLVFQPSSPPTRGVETVGAVQYQVYSYDTVFSAVKPGEVRIEPVTVEATVRLPADNRFRDRRRESIFDRLLGADPFFDSFLEREYAERVSLTTDPMICKVLPLPKEGRPGDFRGAIGDFRLEVEADPARLKVDEALTVRARIAGQGNFDRIQELSVEEGEDWKAYPATSVFTASDQLGRSGEKQFEQVFFARGPTGRGPEIAFSFFDPLKREYVRLIAPPVPVLVTGAAAPPTFPSVGDSAGASDGRENSAGGGDKPVIRGAVRNWAAGPRPYILASPRFAGMQVAGVLMVAAVLAGGAWARGRRDPAQAAKRLWKAEKRRLLAKLADDSLSPEAFTATAADVIALLGSSPGERRHTTSRQALVRLQAGRKIAGADVLEGVVSAAEKLRWSRGAPAQFEGTATRDAVRNVLLDLAGDPNGERG
ncbi:MAG TPA: BatD family protein [Verrucomicrobiales bacterium]|nr:BatD family protein [Verrucomicrobiales bacterium]